MFRDAFKRRRCVIPMSGFYDWRQIADGKQPFFISGIDAPLLSVAGFGTIGKTEKSRRGSHQRNWCPGSRL
jgi:putative SOS response-associated peptidase YedK